MGDFDGDGVLDLAVAGAAGSNTDGSVQILKGDGGLSMGPAMALGKSPSSIAAADLNGDGASDVAVANRASSSVSVLWSAGSGGFVREDLTLGYGPSTVVLEDLNGDGVLDLATAGTHLGVFVGNGLGRLVPRSDLVLGTSPDDLALGDLDGNGIADLVAVRGADRSLRLLFGDGAGRFALAGNLPSGGNAVAVGDFARDGLSDLAIADSSRDTVSVVLGQDLGELSLPHSLKAGKKPGGLAGQDMDGDGVRDLAVANRPERLRWAGCAGHLRVRHHGPDAPAYLRGGQRGGVPAVAGLARIRPLRHPGRVLRPHLRRGQRGRVAAVARATARRRSPARTQPARCGSTSRAPWRGKSRRSRSPARRP